MNTDSLEHSHIWRGDHKGLRFEIVHWGLEDGPNGPTKGRGHWNFYVFIPEQKVENFGELWINPEIAYFTEGNPSSAYLRYEGDYSSPLNVDGWNGGITYWEGNNNIPFKRWIKVGCDYGHLWDMERGFPATLQSVLGDCVRTINNLLEVVKLKTPEEQRQPSAT